VHGHQHHNKEPLATLVRWITAPLPLKVAYFGLACAVLFGLTAAIAGIEFGREAEDQVVEATEDLPTIASLGGGPVLVMGLISSFARRRTSGRPWQQKQQ
jgi:hypothetical protein